jgi:hypothetical protein
MIALILVVLGLAGTNSVVTFKVLWWISLFNHRDILDILVPRSDGFDVWIPFLSS